MQLRSRSYGDTLQLSAADFSTSLVPLTKFTPFPRLPLEIRMRIWQIAMKDIKRVVEIMIYSVPGYPRHYWTDAVPPAILSVSKESRKYAMEIVREEYVEDTWTNDYYDEFCGTLESPIDGVDHYGYEDLMNGEVDEDKFTDTCACPQPREHDHDEDNLPIYNHFTNYTTNIVYFNFAHNSVRKWASCCRAVDNEAERIAISFDYRHKEVDGIREDDDAPLWEMLCLSQEVRQVFLVFGDDCCGQGVANHRRIKELTTENVVIPNEFIARLAEFHDEFRQYWKERGRGEDAFPGIIIVRAIRE